MMTSFIFIWLLLLTASGTVTSALLYNLSNVTAGEELTTKDMSTLEQRSEISGLNITPSTTEDMKPLQDRSTSSLQMVQTPPTTILMSTKPAATSGSTKQVDFTRSTANRNTAIENPRTTVRTHQGDKQTDPSTTEHSEHQSFTQSHGTSKPAVTPDKVPSPPIPTSPSVTFMSTATSIKPEKDKSTSSQPATSGDTVQPSGSYKTTAAIPFTQTHEGTKNQDLKTAPSQTNHGKIAAGLIGGALLMMMVGFLVIYVKKQRLQKQQTTTAWAGPSPFLQDSAENDQVALRSSSRISLSSFLPQRLSKRLSLLPENGEELQDMTPTATFGGKHQENMSDQSVDGRDVQEKKDGVASEGKEGGEDAADHLV